MAVSRDLYPQAGQQPTAVLVSGEGFADALPGTPLAKQNAGPLLLTTQTRLPDPTAAELVRVVRPGGIVVAVGGTAVISDAVLAHVRSLGFVTERAAGPNRYATALEVAGRNPSPRAIFIADGHTFTDGLVAAATAALMNGVLVLTAGATVDGDTAAFLNSRPDLPRFAIGTNAAAAVPSAEPIVGRSPGQLSSFATARFNPTASFIGLASSADYPDGLAGGLHAAVRGGSLMLTEPTLMNTQVLRRLDELDLTGHLRAATLYGGTAALGPDIEATAAEEVAGGSRTVFNVSPRQCFDNGERTPGNSNSRYVLDRPCTSPHAFEVIALVDIANPDRSYPGTEQLFREGVEICVGSVFEQYVGIPYESSTWRLGVVVPAQTTWDDGERQTMCYVDSGAGRTSTPAHQSYQ